MGRFGNWFNNEIYGAPTDLPWRLKIYEWDSSAGHAVLDSAGNPIVKGYFHPTFLYEALWCLLLAAVLLWLGRRFALKQGQVFAAYVMGYPIGRIVIENMRSDSANHIFGQRVNTWVSILVFLFGVWLWFRFAKMPPFLVPAPPGDDITSPDAAPSPDAADAADAADPADQAEAAQNSEVDDVGDPDEPDGPDRPDSGPGERESRRSEQPERTAGS